MRNKIKINPDLKMFMIFLILFIVFEVVFFNSGNPVGRFIMADIPANTIFPDLMEKGYSGEELSKFFIELGARGRQIYFRNIFLVDIILPVLYALFYLFILKFLVVKITKIRQVKYAFITLPVIAALFDYTENICMLFLIKQFPDINESLIKISSFATVMKWNILNICFFAGIILLFVYTGLVIFGKIKSRSKNVSEQVV